MERKRASKLKGDIRREQIIDAVLRLAARGGARALRTAAIAEEAGVSEANIYRHFKSKGEILRTVIDRIKRRLLQNLDTVTAMRDRSPVAQLRELFELHLRYLEENEGIPRIIFSEEVHTSGEGIKDEVLHTIELYASKVESVVKRGQESGIIRNDLESSFIVTVFLSLIQMLTMRWSLSNFSFSLLREGMKLWEGFETCFLVK